MASIFLTVICPAIRHLANVNKITWRKVNEKVIHINKDWLRKKNQDDILLLRITGMNEINLGGGGGWEI